LSHPTHQIQTLLTQVNNALHQLSPPIPVLVWGEGVVQSREALQQVQLFLLNSLEKSPTAFSNSQQNQTSPFSNSVTEELADLHKEVEELRQERHRLRVEIQQLQIQQSSVIPDHTASSASITIPEVPANLTDSLPPTPEISPSSVEPTRSLSPQNYDNVDEDLSDIFGQLHINQASSLEPIPTAASTEVKSSQILDAAIHLESPEPPLDGQEYILASPHENLLPVDEDEDQVDSLLLVGRGTLQRLESELMSLEDAQNQVELLYEQELKPDDDDDDADEFAAEVPSFEELYAQFKQTLPRWKGVSDSSPSTLGELLEQSHSSAIPSPPEVETLRLEALSLELDQSNLNKKSKKTDNT
jgi:cell division septum initiation protein DivIVA